MNCKTLETLITKFKLYFCFADKEYQLHFENSRSMLELLGHSLHNGKLSLIDLFPELFGAEIELGKIFSGVLEDYEIPKINRLVNDVPIFFNLCITKSKEFDHLLLVMVEDISDEGILHRQLQQNRNENEMLRLEMQRKNSVLENTHSELKKANNELKKLLRLKDDFLAIASHDLRSPFNAILGFTEVLLDEKELDAGYKEMIALINQSATMQLKYINDMLNVLKLETGQIKLNLHKHSLNELIAHCTGVLSILAANKKIHLLVDIPQDFIIKIDFEKIAQVINNLISNAIKFTPRGGQIIISVVEKSKQWIELYVKDTGEGIESDMLPRLFSRYTKTHRNGTEGEMGTGLGLAICKNLINLHKGVISVKSNIGQGSEFRITLPRGY